MKIVHLCLSNFYIDNYSYQENLLPKYHVLQGHEVTVIASMVSFDDKGKLCYLKNESCIYTKEGFKVIRVDYCRPFYAFNKYVRRYRLLHNLLNNESPDILFIHDFSFLDITKVIRYIKENRNVKVYVDCHTDYINSAKSWFSKYIFHHLIWRYYAHILAPYVIRFYGTTPLRCDFLKEAYHIKQEKIDLLVMGIDDVVLKDKNRGIIRKAIRKRYDIVENDFLIVSGGKIDALKNIHLLAEAVTKLKYPNVKLLLFGTIAPEFENVMEKFRNDRRIIFIGWINTDSILDCILASDLVCFPGTHSVLWEQTVGLGIPSIFKYWNGITHVDVGGNCRFLYNECANEIFSILSEILEHPSIYEEMKTVALEKGLKSFSYSEIAKKAIDSN